MSIHERIKSRRKECGLTADEVAKQLGVSRATVYRYESAEIVNMGVDKIQPLARVLRTTPEYLMGWSDEPEGYYEDDGRLDDIPLDMLHEWERQGLSYADIVKSWEAVKEDEAKSWGAINTDHASTLPEDTFSYIPTHRIPILGRIVAGMPIYAEENIEGYTYTDLNGGAEYFALRVVGDSMDLARIYEGDILIVRRQDVVEPGEIAVVMVGEDEATVKRFYQADTVVTLIPESTNPKHKPQVYNLSEVPIRILGKVVKVEFMVN